MDTATRSKAESQFPERWTTERLAEEMPGTSRKWWRSVMAPELVRLGVLRKVGHAWLGRRDEIIAALAQVNAQ